MVYSRQVCFEGPPPSIPDIIERVRQRTGIKANYLASKWLLANPLDSNDVFSLYAEGECCLLLINEGTETELLRATLYTLLELGGYYQDWYE
ncbi:hypothetical protein [Spirosoma radiotolerans]|uniref:Uncharacterized protein n=1 Tax=Spirosoma radiotolerans TaxID=1379870 RepID=A0A0E3V7U5_9BACT|nr:hypothetical protein [Spirosoma radiotolerans]AKD56172.1 hypothetical protein SD10_15975 [Spirosoma radiotolerans]